MDKKIFTWLGAAMLLAGLSSLAGYAQSVTTPTDTAGIATSATKDTLRLTLQDALQVAMSESRTLKIADQEVEKANYDKRSAIAKLLPTVDASGDYSYTLKKQVMYLGSMKMPGMPEGESNKGIEVGRSYQVAGGISAGMPLLNVQLWKSVQLSKEAMELAVLKSEESKITLYTQVIKAYYGIMLAQESAKVIQQSYDNAKVNYEQIANRYSLGMVAEFDKIRADVAVKNLEPQLQDAQNAIRNAQNQLRILLSLPLEQPIACVGELKDLEGDMYRKYFNATALPTQNNQLKQLDAQIQMLRTQLSMAKSAFLPTVTLSGVYRTSAMDDAFSWRNYIWSPYSMVQLTLSIPLFRGGDRINAVKKSQLSLQQAQLQRQQLQETVQVQAQQYQDNIKTAVKQYVTAKEAITQAEKGYEIAKKRYDLGSSTLVELNDANLVLAQTRLGYLQSIYGYISNEADLQAVYGITPILTPQH